MAYSKYHEDWEDYPSEATPITAAALEHIETGIATVATEADDLDTRVTDLEGAPAPVLDLGTGPAAEAVQPRRPTPRGSCPHGRAQAECSAAVRAAPAVRALHAQIRPDE